jgi:hypothetical protein
MTKAEQKEILARITVDEWLDKMDEERKQNERKAL